ncbi:MAG: hypothetical protein JWQ10_776, partial [Herbaspirillum sp.]|nr:hypothetical protein [Herbaspirillum sp.]
MNTDQTKGFCFFFSRIEALSIVG